ncbi:peroxisomal multifunctional enzyme type 2 isoform X1 [Folsomia candida]|uniref:peroxisomal multifunctional enzyme type 2 isoform X1 n=1 Tax=Folsomia candida TaxID=158441 RepID=UPI000B8EFE7F|nr:peroxisomal multifunctional enzyme type 2 isoform X1 [Folsomia candida]
MFRLGQLASIFGGRNLFIMQQSTRFASIISDGRGKCDESFDSNYKMCFGPSSESHLGIKDVTKENVWGYKFPQVCLKYGKEDSIQHALAVGIDASYPNSSRYLDRGDKSLHVLPTFLLPLANKILMELSRQSQIIPNDRTVHGEIYIKMLHPLEPEGEIWYDLELVDILDKGKGTLYCYNFHGTDTTGTKIFLIEYQMYEIGTGSDSSSGKGRPTRSEKVIPILPPPQGKEPDVVFPFTVVPFDPKYFDEEGSPLAKNVSIYSTQHYKQYYSITDKLRPEPRCHGRYYLGGVIQSIFKYFGDGDASKFKSVKTRLAYPVSPGETILTKAWHLGERIQFETFSKQNGKCVLQASYIDLD